MKITKEMLIEWHEDDFSDVVSNQPHTLVNPNFDLLKTPFYACKMNLTSTLEKFPDGGELEDIRSFLEEKGFHSELSLINEKVANMVGVFADKFVTVGDSPEYEYASEFYGKFYQNAGQA